MTQEVLTARGVRVTATVPVEVVEHPELRSGQAVQEAAGLGATRRAVAMPGAVPPLLLTVMTGQGFTVFDAITLGGLGDGSGKPAGATVRRAAVAPATLTVPLAVDEGAVVLVERDGVYAWLWPEPEPEPVSDTGGVTRAAGAPVARFTLTGLPPQAPAAAGPVGPHGGTRALLGLVPEWIRAYVLKFIARGAVTSLSERLDGRVTEGLIEIGGPDVDAWAAVAASPDLLARRRPQGVGQQPARVLLLLHGTFSSTRGSFRALGGSAEGWAFLAAATAEYDLVLGYDHRTLSVAPEANAAALAQALAALALPPDSVIDAIAYSRGGLVYRYLAEGVLAVPGAPVRWGTAVLAGCPNGGTHLATPTNWARLIDIVTNAGSVAAGLVQAVPGAGTVVGVLDELLTGLGGLIQYAAETAITDRAVPGLAAMEPESQQIAALNGAPLPADGAGPTYYAITADFDPTTPVSLGGAVAGFLADRVANVLIGDANDLVIDTESMTKLGAHRAWLKDHLAFSRTDGVYHTVYFHQPRVAERLGVWLGVGGDDVAGGRRRVSFFSESLVGATLSSPSPSASLLGIQGRLRPQPVPASRSVSGQFSPADRATMTIDMASEPSVIPAPDTLCHYYAEMDSHPLLAKPAEIKVTVSQEDLQKVLGPTVAGATAATKPDKRITVLVKPRHNCAVVGDDRAEIDPPPPGHPQELCFEVKGQQEGAAEVVVEARQGAIKLVTLVLQPTFVAANAPLRAAALGDARRPDLPVVRVRILEEPEGGGQFRLCFIVESEDLNIRHVERSEPIRVPRQTYVADLYKRIEKFAALAEADYEKFLGRLRDEGASLYAALVPKAIRTALWAQRERIGCVEVISEEPFIPWELAVLVDDQDQIAESGSRFLAEVGLVRWLANSGWAPAGLRVRANRVFHVTPDYPVAAMKLAGAQAERMFLKREFGARPAPTDSAELVKLLRNPTEVDVLHIACHGDASGEAIWNASVLMTGTVAAGRYVPDPLTVDQVRRNAKLAHPDGSRPIVFLNACQAGRAGYHLTGTGGMAEAFLRTGAGLFVGALWSVGDRSALEFAKTLYQRLFAGDHLTAATRAAREASKAAGEPTWLAYTVYGHPYARVSRES